MSQTLSFYHSLALDYFEYLDFENKYNDIEELNNLRSKNKWYFHQIGLRNKNGILPYNVNNFV